MARRRGGHAVAHKGAGGAGPNVIRAIVIITCVSALGTLAGGFAQPASPAESASDPAAPTAELTPVATPEPSAVADSPDPSAAEEMEPTPVPHVGIVAGHWQFDQGASCPDGLDEVDINLDVAERVVQALRDRGYQVDLLAEYDDRLSGYLADALVSIHADSCERLYNATPPPTGFKVASVVDSYVPEEEQRLVACLRDNYGARTGLARHDNSITGHMTQYHTFYEIDGRTPGAIIEIGFLWLDRDLLTQRPDMVAQGVVDGVVCFIEGN